MSLDFKERHNLSADGLPVALQNSVHCGSIVRSVHYTWQNIRGTPLLYLAEKQTIAAKVLPRGRPRTVSWKESLQDWFVIRIKSSALHYYRETEQFRDLARCLFTVPSIPIKPSGTQETSISFAKTWYWIVVTTLMLHQRVLKGGYTGDQNMVGLISYKYATIQGLSANDIFICKIYSSFEKTPTVLNYACNYQYKRTVTPPTPTVALCIVPGMWAKSFGNASLFPAVWHLERSTLWAALLESPPSSSV